MSMSKDNAIAYVVRRDDGVYWDYRHDKWDDEWDAPLEDIVFGEQVTPKMIVSRDGGRVVALGELPEPVEVTKEEADVIHAIKNADIPARSIDNYTSKKTKIIRDVKKLQNRLMHAFVNGYKVVRPKRFIVKAPDSWMKYGEYAFKYINGGVGFMRPTNDDKRTHDYVLISSEFQFTEEELKQYWFDADIFEKEEVPEDDAN